MISIRSLLQLWEDTESRQWSCDSPAEIVSINSTHLTPPGVHGCTGGGGGGRDDSITCICTLIYRAARVRPTPFDTHKVFKWFEEAGIINALIMHYYVFDIIS